MTVDICKRLSNTIEGNAEHVTDLVVRGNLGINHLSLADASHKEVFATDSIYIDMETINPGKAIFHFNTIAVNGIKTGFELRKDGNTMSDLFLETPEDTVQQPPISKSAPSGSIIRFSPSKIRPCATPSLSVWKISIWLPTN